MNDIIDKIVDPKIQAIKQEQIVESMTQVNKHLQDKAFAILTAYRKNGDVVNGETVDIKVNKRNFKALGNDCLSNGFSFFVMSGSWIDEKTKERVYEDSMFVVPYNGSNKPKTDDEWHERSNDLYKWALKQSKHYDQDSFIFKDAVNGNITLHNLKSSPQIIKFDGTHFNKMDAEMYSRLKNKPHNNFVFENRVFDVHRKTWSNALSWKYWGE